MAFPLTSTTDETVMLPLACPIPLPPGSINGTAFGPQDCITIEEILSELSPIQQIDGRIIIVMQETTIGNGMTPDAILTALETRFPNTNDWTIELVTSRLLVGKRAGRFQLNRFGVWYILSNMAQLNVVNNVFTFLVPTLLRNPSCITSVSTTFNGYFSGINSFDAGGSCASAHPRLNRFLSSSFFIPTKDS
jgi:hypothetical protein